MPRLRREDVATALNQFDAFYDGVVVTRSGSGAHGDAYLYSVYFGAGASDGAAGAGDVATLAVDTAMKVRSWPSRTNPPGCTD